MLKLNTFFKYFKYLTSIILISSSLSLIPGATAATVDHALFENRKIEKLEQMAKKSYLLKHDFLKCFENGEFKNMTHATLKFAENHYIYSSNFINYLRSVVGKISDKKIASPILENIAEESGNYSDKDLETMKKAGILPEWFNNKPHKELFMRFLNSLNVDPNTVDLNSISNQAGKTFTDYMLQVYADSNACEALSVIGFAIEETVSILYGFIWRGLQMYTQIHPRDYVFFPLHILIDDGHADLLKLGFQSYLNQEPELCENAENIINAVLKRRIQMFDELRDSIEQEQGYRCPIEKNADFHSKQCNEDNQCIHSDLAVKQAQEETTNMRFSQDWSVTQKMAIAARILADQGHGNTLSGQISCVNTVENSNEILMWVNAYGKSLEVLSKNDFILVDKDLKVRQNKGLFPNKATRFHSHIYQQRPDIKCIIHTHPPKTSALSMTGLPLHIAHMDVMAFYEDVQFLPEWPGIPFGDNEGEVIAGLLDQKYWSALLAHHGLIVAGRTLEEATYRAYFFERAAGMQIDALAANGGNLSALPKVNPNLARKARDWRISTGPVNAHFHAWAESIFKKGHGDCVL